MDPGRTTFRFGDFRLEVEQQRLTRSGREVALAPRYFNALLLLASHPGELIAKDRFFGEVWSGVTVGDEALTQAIKDLRRALGDSAGEPSFIQTVPKRGYRFIAAVERMAEGAAAGASAPGARPGKADYILAGTLGGGGAGLIGGLVYGLVAGMGNASALAIVVVMTVIATLIGLVGALALSLGMAAASRIAERKWLFSIAGAGTAGFLVGEIFHRIASDSFSLFIGRPHEEYTGGLEGLVLGAAIAAGARLGGGIDGRWPRPILGAAAGGAAAGVVLSLLGGQLMASSLAALARRFHGSQLELGLFGRLSGEDGPGALAEALVAGGEGLMFGALMVAAILHRARKAH